MINIDKELIKDIQKAIDSIILNLNDSKLESFLNYLEYDLRQEAELEFSNLIVWSQVKDEGKCEENLDCRKISLGTHKLPNQSRTHKHGDLDYRYETRGAKMKAFASFSSPRIDDIWEDIKTCAIGASITAVIVAISSGDYNTAMALFYPTFYACLASKIGERAKEVDVTFSRNPEYDCWKYHCN